MIKYRKKPVVIDACQLPDEGSDLLLLDAWFEEVGFTEGTWMTDGRLEVKTLEGPLTAQPGDWIIKGVKGEFYPCKPDIFAQTYEVVDDS